MNGKRGRNTVRAAEPGRFWKLRNRLTGGKKDPVFQFRLSILLLITLVLLGTIGFTLIEGWAPLDSLYMTVITLTTVGFGEVRPLHPAGKVFAMVIIVLGVGVAAWAVSNGMEVILGDAFWTSYQRRKIKETVMQMRDHFVVCGYGRLGRQIVRDLEARGEPFVVIDHDRTLEQELLDKRIPHLIVDATQDESLIEAGIERARGLVCCLDNDAANVLATLTARELNPALLVVARSETEAGESRLRRAGADRQVTPEAIGGHRLALALLRPAVHDFLERVFSFGADSDADIGQVTVHESSPLAGQTVARCDLRRLKNISILAVRNVTGGFELNPPPGRTIAAGETLIVIGPRDGVYELEAMLGDEGG